MSSPSPQNQYEDLKAHILHKALIARMAYSLFEAGEKAIYGDNYPEVEAYKKRIRALEAEVEELRMWNLRLRYEAMMAEQGITEGEGG